MSSTGSRAEHTAEVAALVALLQTGRRAASAYAELTEQGTPARALLQEEQGLLADELVENAAREVAGWSEEGIRALPLLDPDYPANLRAVHDRPPLIFIAGRLEPRDTRSVAVIGSRRASADGLRRARRLVEQLLVDGYTIASGLAAGVDTAAHETALAHGGRTIAVIGTGLRHSYPRENAVLQRRIAVGGAVVSQFWPDTGPDRQNFPLRNAVMSGLSLATLIIEAGQTSGARIQARLALGQGRPVLITTWMLEQQWARELAARPGVHVVDSANELTNILARLTGTDTLVA